MESVPRAENQVKPKSTALGVRQFVRSLTAIIWKDLAA